jgi:hypothetical protein
VVRRSDLLVMDPFKACPECNEAVTPDAEGTI